MTEPQAVALSEGAPEPAPIAQKMIAVGGREVLFRALSDTQVAQMNHEIMVLEGDRYDTLRRRKAMDRVYRALQSTIVEPDDRDFIADLMADGELDLRFLVDEALKLWQEEPTAPKVRRGRPPRRR